MRKLLLFLLIFGIGLGVLLGVARWREGRRLAGAPPAVVPGGGETGQPMVPVPEGEEGQEDVSFRFDGRLEYTGFDPVDPQSLPTFRIVVDDLDHLRENEHELKGITLDFFSPETGDIRATLEAERGRAHMRPVAAEPRFQQDKPARLWDVELLLLSDAPFVPLTAWVSIVDLDLDARTFTSEEPVRLEGSGMEASCVGLVVREPDGLVRLVREGSIDLRLEDQTRIELDATGDGPIDLVRHAPNALGEDPAPDEEQLSLEASGGARLVVEGAESLRSDSDTLVVRGRRGGAGARFEPESADAGGGVVILRDSDRFTGREAHLDFAADGQPQRAVLSGDPVARVWVDAGIGEDEPARRVLLEIRGAGPMTAGLALGTTFSMGGPGRAEIEELGFSVDASESIAGEIDRDGHRGEVHLIGDVVARGETATYRGPALDLTFRRDERDEPVVDGHSPGPAHIEWLDDTGELVQIDTVGEADWVRVGEDLLVPFARQATVRLEGEGGLVASAGLLQDFRRSTLSFEGSQGVEIQSNQGRASAPRVVARGADDVTFLGEGETPATFILHADPERGLEGAMLRAQSVVRRGEVATAEGDVLLTLAGEQGHHELECEWLELRSPALLLDATRDVAQPFEVRARGVRRATFRGDFGSGTVEGRELFVRGRLLPAEPEPDPEPAPDEGDGGPGGAGGPPRAGQAGQEPAGDPQPADAQDDAATGGRVELELVEVVGGVSVDFSDEAAVQGDGDRFEWRPDGGGRLGAERGRRATARVTFAEGELPYRVSAEWIEFGERSVRARWPRLSLEKAFPDPRLPGEDLLIGASAEWMEADEDGAFFAGLAHLVGRMADGTDWELNAGAVHAEIAPREEGEPDGPTGALRGMVAWEGFDVTVGDVLTASGDVLEADFRVLRMEGAPARMELSGLALESSHIEYDIERTLVQTEQGRAIGVGGSEFEGWTIDYESLEPFEALDTTILVVRNIRVRDEGGRELRAGWALFWVDRDRWQTRTRDLLGPGRDEPDGGASVAAPGREQPAQEPVAEVQTIFGRLRTGTIAQVLTEAYVEGDVEFLRDGDRYARMDAAYLDLVDGHGWLQNAEVYWDLNISDQPARLVARAEWMRHSDDGSLHADRATVTACDFHEPHLFIQTRDLRLTPVPEKPGVFKVALKKNSLRFDNGISMPLPPLTYPSDEQGRPLFGELTVGSSARFGNFVGGTFNAGLGAAGGAVARLVGSEEDKVEGGVSYRASWLGSRGLLVGAGLDATVDDRFWLRLFGEAVYDSGEDRGMVRVPVDERPDLRYHLSGRSRYITSEREWFDFAFNHQSDAGVQAEFDEGRFLNYERRDNFVHWRKAENEYYQAMTASVRLDDFRNYLERLPEATLYGGKTPVGEVNGLPLLYSNDTQAGLLRTRAGTEPFSPFDPAFQPGVGDRDVLRVDTIHRFEVPFALREGSWRVAPFTSVQGSFWSEDYDQDGYTARGDLYAGAEASTNFTRVGGDGLATTFTPTVGLRADVANLQSGGDPVPLDELEYTPREGFLVDLGLRTRLWKAGSEHRLTLDLRGTHGSGVDQGQDGWLPIGVLAEFETRVAQMPVFLLHDGRYDPDDSLTVFSRSITGFVPIPTLGIEFGLHTGRDDTQERIYDAASAGARWRATQKWEFEARQVLNLQSDNSLATTLILRRYGHDFVFDLEFSQRSAEGSSIGFAIRPLLGFRRRGIGRIERWLDYDV